MPEETNDAPAAPAFVTPPLPTQPTASALIGRQAKPEPTRSFFRTDATSYATRYHAWGQWFDLNGPADELRAMSKNLPGIVAEKLGMTIEEYTSGGIATSEQAEIARDASEATWDAYLDGVLGDWSLPKDCNSENKKALWPDMKREIFEFATGFFEFGTSEAQFRKSRD